MPEGIGPEAHLAVALRTTHPMARPVVLPERCSRALESQADDPEEVIARRSAVLKHLYELAEATGPENRRLMEVVHPNVRRTAASRNIAFMREVSFICSGTDANLFVDYVFGLPMHGVARHSSTLMQRRSRPPAPPADDEELDRINQLVISRVRPTDDDEFDRAAFAKTEAEFAKGTLI